MDTMKELTGADWPLTDEAKTALRKRRTDRETRVLKNETNREIYDETRLACEVAEMLREARLEAHLTQSQLAERVHTSQSNLARVEKGQNVKLTTLYSYAKACGKRVEVRLV
ncbi:MAG: helix-turn-helix transcriptional regulator [Victivallales bacterium]|jgi:ribosome-binding protein aMBF1 (putative translation factor)|nr:helix-turn-helix transcriptional regulator [Victivallales bacterium]